MSCVNLGLGQEVECETQTDHAVYSRDPETDCRKLSSSVLVPGLNPPHLPVREKSENTLIVCWHHRGTNASIHLPSQLLTAVEQMLHTHTAPGKKQEGSSREGAGVQERQ